MPNVKPFPNKARGAGRPPEGDESLALAVELIRIFRKLGPDDQAKLLRQARRLHAAHEAGTKR